MGYKNNIEFNLRQYKTDNNLKQRIQIHKYGTNKTLWTDWLWNKIKFSDDIKILEIGCGNSEFWIRNFEKINSIGNFHLILSDISEGMVAKSRERLNNRIKNVKFMVFDADKLPLPDNEFDIVIANHMLYHVTNIENTIKEIHSVLKPTGLLYASTNGKNHLKELVELIDMFDLSIDFNPEKIANNFGLETGMGRLEKYFKEIRIEYYLSDLVVPESGSIITYLKSLESADREKDNSKLKKLKKYLNSQIKEKGDIKISKSTGLFICKV